MPLADSGGLVRRYGALFLAAAATLSLVLFPATMCFDCEPDYTFGRSTAINDLGWDLLLFWLLIGPFLAGLLRMKLGWLVPLVVVVADVATQHLGGVPWWDVRNNEGPAVVIFGGLSGGVALLAGYLLYIIATWVKQRWFDPRQPTV